ncbi:MAG TPA: hypothetical protein VF665_10645 [Longimicrobium sp.]|jgi:hypothetical protein|uniref:hypothetical protein n=1 Tax=Longimicrobium sp. TaxID=2029185 RepID=UPI002EDAD426
MSHTLDESAVTNELEDAFEIDYALLPEAKSEPRPRRSLWEIFLIGWEAFTPRVPVSARVTLVRKRTMDQHSV